MSASKPDCVFAGKSSEAYITTLQRPIPGFLVRIPDRRKNGRFFHKSFCKVDGDMDELLKMAVLWRDAAYRQHYGEDVPHRAFHKRQSNSAIFVAGVRKTIKIVKKTRSNGTVAEYKVPCLIAEVWLEPGKGGKRPRKSRSKIYSLNKYSEDEAYAMAISWRQEQEALLRTRPAQCE